MQHSPGLAIFEARSSAPSPGLAIFEARSSAPSPGLAISEARSSAPSRVGNLRTCRSKRFRECLGPLRTMRLAETTRGNVLAERAGFEPADPVKGRALSKRVP